MTILLLTNFWTNEDEAEGRLFSGFSGRVLASSLNQAGINIRDCAKLAVFEFVPSGNTVFGLVGPKVGAVLGLPAMVKGKYLRAEFAPNLLMLHKAIENLNPTLIVALGSEACWAILQSTKLKSIRGAALAATIRGKTYKVLPTFHPSSIVKDWSLRPIFMSDLAKASEEAKFREVRRPSRKIWIEPSLDDLACFEKEHLHAVSRISIDIETAGTQITCIGFAPNHEVALVVPFVSTQGTAHNYWPSLEDELKAWAWVKRICELPNVEMIGQNFMYDIHFLWRNYGIAVKGTAHDTMLLHHAMQPEMQKGLGFLGSIYTNEASWKFMRHANDTVKKED